MADRVSQAPIEIIISPTSQNARVSQAPIEVVVSPTSQRARLSQMPIEVVLSAYIPPPSTNPPRVTQATVEGIRGAMPAVERVTQVAVEPVVKATSPTERVTQVVVEPIVHATVIQRVTQAAVEVIWKPAPAPNACWTFVSTTLCWYAVPDPSGATRTITQVRSLTDSWYAAHDPGSSSGALHATDKSTRWYAVTDLSTT